MKLLFMLSLLCVIKDGYGQEFECDNIYLNADESTTIRSHPGYPDTNYDNHMFHCWIVEGPSNVHFSLWTEDFDLEYVRNCHFDFMEIHCGAEGGSIGRYCGEQGIEFPVHTGGNEVVIFFGTDASEVDRGFELNVRAIDNAANDWTSDCHGDYDQADWDTWDSWDWGSWDWHWNFESSEESDSLEKHHKKVAKMAVQAIIGIVVAVIFLVIVIPCIITIVVCCVLTRQKRNNFGGAGATAQTYAPPNGGQAMVMTTQNAGYPVQQPNAIGGYTPQNVNGGYAAPIAPGGYTQQSGYGYPAAGNIAQPPAYQPAGTPEKSPQALQPVMGPQNNANPPTYDNQVYLEVQ